MPDTDRAPDDPASPPPPEFPWYVRLLAVAYVLSRIVGFVGFLLLAAVGSYLWVWRDGAGGWGPGLMLAALACPALGAAFRAWFVRWGRRNYPVPEEEVEPQQTGSPGAPCADAVPRDAPELDRPA